MGTLTKQELIELVTKLMRAEGSEEELDRWQRCLEANVPDPKIADYIYYPDRPMTAAEIIERALAYKPMSLSDRGDENRSDVSKHDHDRRT